MNEKFFPKVAISDGKMLFNNEAVESMNLDIPDAKIAILEVTNPAKAKNNKEILLVKTNGSLFDAPDNVKDVIDPSLIRVVSVTKKDDEITAVSVDMPEASMKSISDVFGELTSFKLLICNMDSALGKEFREVFDVKDPYYRLTTPDDKRVSIGKERNLSSSKEERISLNAKRSTMPIPDKDDEITAVSVEKLE
jgi:hypothetical protein